MGVSEFVAVLAGVLVFETLTGKLLLAETMAPVTVALKNRRTSFYPVSIL